MSQQTPRLVIYPAEMMKITGRCERVVRRWIAEIKRNKKKANKELITIIEFCEHLGLDETKVRQSINGSSVS
jgi:hypothetical protein